MTMPVPMARVRLGIAVIWFVLGNDPYGTDHQGHGHPVKYGEVFFQAIPCEEDTPVRGAGKDHL